MPPFNRCSKCTYTKRIRHARLITCEYSPKLKISCIYYCILRQQPYDEASFNEKNSGYGFELRYYKGHLNLNNVILTQGVGCRVYLRKRYADAEVIRQLAANGVKLLAALCRI